jgi:hypothetical protein
MTKTIAIAAALLAAAPTLAVAQSLYTNDLNERPLYVPFYAPPVTPLPRMDWSRSGGPNYGPGVAAGPGVACQFCIPNPRQR